jgi:hypothetical protein
MYRGGFFAHTSTVGLTGTLDSIDLALSRLPAMQSDLLFEITATMPEGEPLPTLGLPALQRIPYGAIPVGMSPSWVTIDLSGSGILVHEGERLALVLKLDVVRPVPADPSRVMEILLSEKGRTRSNRPQFYPFEGSVHRSRPSSRCAGRRGAWPAESRSLRPPPRGA